DSDGNVIKSTEPVVRRQVVSKDTSKRVSAMLENAVSGGSIRNAYISGYRVAGKTGTSEKTETKNEDKEQENVEIVASFGGFAPADDPRVAVLVMVDEPQYLKSGGGVAAPAAKKILKDILPYLGVEPNYTEAEIANLDRSTPNVVGSTLSAAATTLKSSTLTYHTIGDGERVVNQIPAAGTTIPKGGAVWLYTDDSDVKMTTVPDFVGRSVAQVNQAANTAGLNVQLSGISTTGGKAISSKQSVTPGTKVPKGTVITVEFTYEDHIY
ncbi:MAG: PASTA domain-containing protein, partial [Clostridia bacterium]|nr:PASTA domain-containing protein [Clostridia bacterium]